LDKTQRAISNYNFFIIDEQSIITFYLFRYCNADGRVRLQEGSAVLYGALSHLATRGLDNYADEVVPCPGLNYSIVANNIIVPLGGIYIVMDLDCWLQGGDISVPDALTLSGREKIFSPIVTKLFSCTVHAIWSSNSLELSQYLFSLPKYSNF
jgi:hypothetical protein